MNTLVLCDEDGIGCQHHYVPLEEFVSVNGYVIGYGYNFAQLVNNGRMICDRCKYILGTNVYKLVSGTPVEDNEDETLQQKV